MLVNIILGIKEGICLILHLTLACDLQIYMKEKDIWGYVFGTLVKVLGQSHPMSECWDSSPGSASNPASCKWDSGSLDLCHWNGSLDPLPGFKWPSPGCCVWVNESVEGRSHCTSLSAFQTRWKSEKIRKKYKKEQDGSVLYVLLGVVLVLQRSSWVCGSEMMVLKCCTQVQWQL